MAKHKITDSRLRDVARAAAARALVEMGQRLGVTIPEEALQCVYLGVEEDGAPRITRLVCDLNGGVAQEARFKRVLSSTVSSTSLRVKA